MTSKPEERVHLGETPFLEPEEARESNVQAQRACNVRKESSLLPV